jgi:ectoine hydroxylase-related dioxygenase (phytanoyl-CoA dioxygenase family)
VTLEGFANDDPQIAEFFREHGWVVVNTFDPEQAIRIGVWVDELEHLPASTGVLHYRELTDHGPVLCRTENFVPSHAEFRQLLTSGALLATASALVGEPAVLYKEKVNYKLAGGAGFAPHQDAPAYPFVQQHVSCMVAVDDSDASNGCLEVVDACHHHLIPTNEVGCIPDEVAAAMTWTKVPLRAGQVLWFHSWAPHRSGSNTSSRHRRALYPTYNALREGDLRDEYYREKLERMAASTVGSNVQVSLIGDFLGRPVT